ncbi:MAG: hypothetical protein PHQ80_00775 [Candidatus ainarchaeum sp.]|nr:hypothetical protein [Candidatus ainarchaeum sp.]MDD5096116.1 hypothetical protein [Candidatus ainarchaeum sp.]
MESPTPSQPPRTSQMRSLSPHPARDSRGPSPRSTSEIPLPLVDGMRRPPIPESRLDREMAAITLVILNLGPKLNAEQITHLEAAAEAARNIRMLSDISPKSEFFARLEGGPDLFMLVLEEFRKIAP